MTYRKILPGELGYQGTWPTAAPTEGKLILKIQTDVITGGQGAGNSEPDMGPMLAPWTLLSGSLSRASWYSNNFRQNWSYRNGIVLYTIALAC